LETCCGYGYGLERESLAGNNKSSATTSRTHIFKGRHERFGHHKSRGAFRNLRPYLWLNHFQGLALSLTKKRQLFPRLVTTSVSLFLLPVSELPQRVTACSASKFGIINPISFRQRSAGVNQRLTPTSPLRDAFTLLFPHAFAFGLGPTDPCSTTVHMEPFSSSVLKDLT
jgi:hypothetical protein